jgi:FlaA1/EpsC-like NDP-sugar epimerase
MILVSSDKAVRPTNIMGATKRFAEKIIQTAQDKSESTAFAAVRFGNVLGSHGSVIPLFKQQIESGGPVTVTDKDVTRYFMTIPESVSLILEAASYAKKGEIFVLDMGEPVRIVDLAEKMIRLAGLRPYEDIDIEFIGLRDGEKKFEELILDDSMKKTHNQKIFIDPSQETLKENWVDDLKRLDTLKGSDVKALLKSFELNYTEKK